MTAFSGIRIIDFSGGIAGPMATMLLGDLGAEVIKVEPLAGDRMKDHPGYLCWNRNKQVVTLDLHTFAGLSAARSLLATADMAVFDWHPGELERSGLDAVTVRAANPALLHAWFPPYSPHGRWSQLPPDEALLSAVSGVSWLQMSYEDRPTYLISPQVQYGQAMIGAGVLASALVERAKSGEGQAITVSGLHGVSAVESGGTIRAADMFRMGGRGSRGGVPNYRLYECADGEWFFLGTLTPQFFLKALEATDMLHLMAWEQVGGEFTNLLKPDINPLVIAALEERFKEKPRAEWLKILHDNDVPRGPVGKSLEWFRSETARINEMHLEFEHPTLGKVELPGVPVKLTATPGSVRSLPISTKLDAIAQRAAPKVSPRAPAGKRGGPLSGIRILDLGAFIAGTFAPGILANWGADSIKVEPIDGDPFRTYGLGFIGYNRGKRGLSIDLKNPKGREAFLDLVRVSDVVLDNYRTGVRERLGIDYQTLKAINPRIISCSVTGYGPVGELSPDPGFDPLVQARSGLMDAQGGGVEPVFYQIPVNDTASAMVAAFGVVAALFARERTGEGQEVLTCLANQSILTQSGELTWYEGRPANPKGGLDLLGTSATNRLYACSDGWVMVAGTKAEHFPAICIALGHPEWAGRLIAEKAIQEPVEGQLANQFAEMFATISKDEAVDRLLTKGVPAATVTSTADLFESPYMHENNYFEDFEHPAFGAIRGPRFLGEFSRTPGGYPRRSPGIGEHSVEVLRDCGFSEDRISELLAQGVIRQE
ncbi:MAG: CoA transferase [Dehalococcoidia bacterium]|uniref:CaiB/BaiF CoA-transferase family protein n=1 Tax=Candidatus Amarobacter glycogenicus TaxID=3140699 RepID=UPI003134A3B8|nr:CoA transferase [Dehalococcoidia bacterium]